MAALVNKSFAQSFGFARPVVAAYRNKFGVVVDAAINQARFDHKADGTRRGLLVSTGPLYGQHDAPAVVTGDWEVIGPATVFWEYSSGLDGGGAEIVVRRAFYSQNVRSTINACLRCGAHHRTLGAIAGFLPNLGPDFEGFVKFDNRIWRLGLLMGDGAGRVLVDTRGRPLLESA